MNIKHAYQRITRGYSDRDLWSFDSYLCEMIPKGLRQLKKNSNSYPANLKSFDEWQGILDTMIEGFESSERLKHNGYLYLKNNGDTTTLEQNDELLHELNCKSEKGLQLFVKYFGNLWS